VATPLYTKQKTPKSIEGSPRRRAPPRGCDNWFVFLHRKNTHPVLKYPVFVKTLKKNMFLFSCIRLNLSKLKKLIFYFHTTKKTSKKIKCFSMHFGFNNQFIKVMRTWPIFQKKSKKFILFSVNIRDYEFIRKTYSRY
jgi:hypothetical protein